MLDDTVPLLVDGYDFVSKRCDELGTDVFETRILLQRTICMRGEEAARLFYDKTRFRREGAAPERLKKTLFGKGGVQGLDGEAHLHRKRMFMEIVAPEQAARLLELAAKEWRAAIERWSREETVVLWEEARSVLFRAACAWAGVPLREGEVGRRQRDVGAMIEGAGGIAARYVRGRIGRERGNEWAAGLVERTRGGGLSPPPGSALQRIAHHRELDGSLLSPHDAAVELLNVIRPTVAVARFITFAALALHEHAEAASALREGDADHRRSFVHEVRRFYPFFPFVAARARCAFDWRGQHFEEGTRTLFDLYGTNHDPRLWPEPDRFDGRRFVGVLPPPYRYVPQGGGDTPTNHRCPGEGITQQLTELAVDLLVQTDYEVPAQDLSISRRHFPAIPRSRFILTGVREGVRRAAA